MSKIKVGIIFGGFSLGLALLSGLASGFFSSFGPSGSFAGTFSGCFTSGTGVGRNSMPWLSAAENQKEAETYAIAKSRYDAGKASKEDAHYGMGGVECRNCEYYGGGKMAECEKVCGLVRADRQCDWYEAK